jgi:hypothetical protein
VSTVKIKVLVVQPDETASVQHVDRRDLPAWQRLVGGYIEAVPLGDGVQVVLNEDGKLIGQAPNRVADALVRTFMERAGRMLRGDDYIAGPAVFYGDPRKGEPTDVPDVVIELVRRAGIEIREEW